MKKLYVIKIDVKSEEKNINEKIKQELKNINNNYVELELINGEFTSLKNEEQKAMLEAIKPYVESKQINEISIIANCKSINKNLLKMLKAYKVKKISLIVNSSNNYVLKKCYMDYTFEDIKKASKMIKWNRFKLQYYIKVGLPDSTSKDDIQTAKDIIKLKPQSVIVEPTIILNKTKLQEEYSKEEFTPLTVIQAVERSKEILILLRKHKIQTDVNNEIVEESKVIAGPYHKEFGKLVEDAIWYEKIVEEIKKINAKVIQVEIESNLENKSNIIGYNNENIEKLKDTYAVIAEFKENNNLKSNKFKINVLQYA